MGFRTENSPDIWRWRPLVVSGVTRSFVKHRNARRAVKSRTYWGLSGIWRILSDLERALTTSVSPFRPRGALSDLKRALSDLERVLSDPEMTILGLRMVIHINDLIIGILNAAFKINTFFYLRESINKSLKVFIIFFHTKIFVTLVPLPGNGELLL